MTPQEFADEMKKISANGDTEVAHYFADELMCKILSSLGYKEGVDVFEEMGKWYA